MIPQSLQKELENLWTLYLVYANSCIRNGVVPAPFGATETEKDIIARLKLIHDKKRGSL